ncbi:unnamed protein product [Rotaria sp. Silwood2]|nr:unnamed protein product [Rotaria sp. Silwood2]
MYSLRLKTLQFNDNRSELFQQLNQWQKTMIENVEIMKKEIYLTHEEYNQEFNRRKKNLLNNDNDDEKNLKEIFNNLKQSLNTLESSHVELIISKQNSTIQLIKPNFNSLFSNSQTTIRPDLDQFLLLSKIVFTLDYDPIDMTHLTTSPEYLIIYKSSRSIFQLLNNIGQHLWDINYNYINYGDLNQLARSAYANGFLLATSNQLLKLNCTIKHICAGDQSILVVHNLGTSLGDVIEHNSNNQMSQRCWKSDLYANEIHMKETMEIFRIRISDHLVAIDALFTDKILICDISCIIKCLFRVHTKQYSILSISPVYGKIS